MGCEHRPPPNFCGESDLLTQPREPHVLAKRPLANQLPHGHRNRTGPLPSSLRAPRHAHALRHALRHLRRDAQLIHRLPPHPPVAINRAPLLLSRHIHSVQLTSEQLAINPHLIAIDNTHVVSSLEKSPRRSRTTRRAPPTCGEGPRAPPPAPLLWRERPATANTVWRELTSPASSPRASPVLQPART